jgi:hypothetical protein
VLILKGDKVFCFDTLLQVLILNKIVASDERRVASGEQKTVAEKKNDNAETPRPGLGKRRT